MARGKQKSPYRYNAAFTGTQRAALDRIARRLGTNTIGAIRRAVTFLDRVLPELDNGRKLALVDGRGRVIKTFEVVY